MALRTPPSWLQNGSHPAENDRLTTKAIYNTTGIIGSSSLAISAQASPNMTVNAATGWAAILSSTANAGVYVAFNDATTILTITTADPTNPRIDRVVMTVNDAAYSGTTNNVVFSVVAGTPAASPTAPTTPNNSISLATIAVAAAATTITAGNITDTRVAVTTNLPVLPLSGGTLTGNLTINGLLSANSTTLTANATTNPALVVVPLAGQTSNTLTIADASSNALSGFDINGTYITVQNNATKYPIKLRSTGTLLSSGVGGAVEYDNSVAYVTPDSAATLTTRGGRALLPAAHYYAQLADRSLSVSTSAQQLFSVTGLTLAPSTAYEVEMLVRYALVWSAGGSVNTTITLNSTGTPAATDTTFTYGGNTTGHSTGFTPSIATSSALPPSIMAYSVAPGGAGYVTVLAKGIWRTGTGSQAINPQFTASVTPFTSATLKSGSYIKLTPIGAAGSTTSVGAWA